MNPSIVDLKIAAGCLAATLLAACASDSKSPAPVNAARSAVTPADSPAAAAYGKLAKGLTGAQVRELLGAPAETRPLTAGGTKSQIWSYPLRTIDDVRQVAVSTEEIPAINPLTGQSTTRTEPVFQNQTFKATDTLHLLMVGDQLVEWSIVRKENSHFH